VEGIICINCVALLCENGLCGRCPICRSENWKKSFISQKTIIPINNPLETPVINVNNNQLINIKPISLPPCKYIVDCVYIACSVLFISYVFGVLTLNLFNPAIKIVENVGWNILALFIGLIELKCTGIYCYNCIKRADM
jgi:di/tricarboxylate transporter